MSAPEAAHRDTFAPRPLAATRLTSPPITRHGTLSALSWAVLMSTLHRVRRGEGALLAVNVSLVVAQWTDPARAAAQLLVSALAIHVMYAFNDLYDAPSDCNNPKKDQALIAVYVEHQRAGLIAALVLHVAT